MCFALRMRLCLLVLALAACTHPSPPSPPDARWYPSSNPGWPVQDFVGSDLQIVVDSSKNDIWYRVMRGETHLYSVNGQPYGVLGIDDRLWIVTEDAELVSLTPPPVD